MSDNKYSILREQGEFFDPIELTDEENDIVKKQQQTSDGADKEG